MRRKRSNAAIMREAALRILQKEHSHRMHLNDMKKEVAKTLQAKKEVRTDFFQNSIGAKKSEMLIRGNVVSIKRHPEYAH